MSVLPAAAAAAILRDSRVRVDLLSATILGSSPVDVNLTEGQLRDGQLFMPLASDCRLPLRAVFLLRWCLSSIRINGDLVLLRCCSYILKS